MTVAKPKSVKKKLMEADNRNSRTIATANTSREESRMNFRLASEVKERVARAAALTGQDLTEFAVTALSEKADTVISRHDQILLGSKDYNLFLDVLAETSISEPSERSSAAAERYRQGTRKGVRFSLAD